MHSFEDRINRQAKTAPTEPVKIPLTRKQRMANFTADLVRTTGRELAEQYFSRNLDFSLRFEATDETITVSGDSGRHIEEASEWLAKIPGVKTDEGTHVVTLSNEEEKAQTSTPYLKPGKSFTFPITRKNIVTLSAALAGLEARHNQGKVHHEDHMLLLEASKHPMAR